MKNYIFAENYLVAQQTYCWVCVYCLAEYFWNIMRLENWLWTDKRLIECLDRILKNSSLCCFNCFSHMVTEQWIGQNVRTKNQTRFFLTVFFCKASSIVLCAMMSIMCWCAGRRHGLCRMSRSACLSWHRFNATYRWRRHWSSVVGWQYESLISCCQRLLVPTQ